MDLFCPHCTSKVSIPDDKAGQVLSCPLCAKQFMAPSLAPITAAPPPPAPPPMTSISAGEPKIEAAATAEPAPPPPPGDYTGSLAVYLRLEWLVFVPPACLFLIFVSSFFSWHNYGFGHSPGLWGLSFITQEGASMQGHFLAYTILMLFPTGPLIVLTTLLDKVFMPPQLAAYSKWKNLLVGLLLLLTFLPLALDYFHAHLFQPINPIALAEKIAIRLHFIALLASFGLFWLHGRKTYNLPAPKLEARW